MVAPNVSHAEILHRLEYAIADEARTLETAYASGAPISMVAWLARNILELLIWIRYCSKSPELAQKFLTDSIRDTIETLEVGKKLAPNPEALAGAKDTLIKTATEDGYQDLDEQFTYVSEAAKEIGAAEAFKIYNKLLSKFAHPTAMLVFSNRKESDEQVKKTFFEFAMFSAAHGERIVEETLAKVVS
jgi:hypothetical protein